MSRGGEQAEPLAEHLKLGRRELYRARERGARHDRDEGVDRQRARFYIRANAQEASAMRHPRLGVSVPLLVVAALPSAGCGSSDSDAGGALVAPDGAAGDDGAVADGGAADGGGADGTAPTPIDGVLAGQTMSGEPIPCAAEDDGVRVCHGDSTGDLRLKSFDGAPLALYVTLPPVPAGGVDGGYPLIVQSHGWGAAPSGPDDEQYGGPTAREWAKEGYAVVQLTARGWFDSCGSSASRKVNAAACEEVYIRLDDARYEARDVQHAIGLLVDEGVADPSRVGAVGESYGGGVTLMLATLNDRVMATDGSLGPWTSPEGTPLHLAGAAVFAGFSDLVQALMPNGRMPAPGAPATAPLSPIGVMKGSIVGGLYTVGKLFGHYAAPGEDPSADVQTWYANIDGGEPYDTPADQDMVEQIARFRSPYYVLAGAYGHAQQAPAPIVFASGFTDDVFPVDQALRYYDLARSLYPSGPLSLLFGDIGHQRAQNKPADGAAFKERIHQFLSYYVGGAGSQPAAGVTALTHTCPIGAPSDGPFTAETWEALHSGTVDFSSPPAQTIESTGGDPAVSKAFDPVTGGLACTTAPATDLGPGVATYRLPAATGAGYTLIGAPAVAATLSVTGQHAYIAARLLDVDPATDTETLVARGLYRIDPSAPNGQQTLLLQPAAWRFTAGHVPKLELLGQDSPYARASNGAFSIVVSNAQVTLPVR